ncbi:MAG TPA: bifunctional phosphopantothenoylcysteine decarboxylase/phosphopantothenate--cysteine ligase CoaBC [Candidatus Dormibacteraeota bacterium]|nr:bifunctional phosphopantothenoylcysteine decarboxylase/phosphopantothenate--cysteine ligase CoaBC [Candidatus Dormibacteraeota bacterium]
MPLDPTPIPDELRGMRIALLVSGGIAAYKIVDLASALTQAQCEVRVAMTASATRFVGPPTFQGVTGNTVLTGFWGAGGSPEPHVFLGDWAQLILVAPATANVVGRIASGRSDDIVTATLLAARCPVVVAPAMNDAMWIKPAVQDNVAALRRRGVTVVEPESGRLASGHEGAGRLAGAHAILEAMIQAVRLRYDYAGRRVVVTAGGTREPIDPVRFISNYSSGKMGFALAAAAADRGARVTLITTVNHPAHHGIDVRRVDTAAEMLAELRAALRDAELLLMAGAVGDFRPAKALDRKIRREDTPRLTVELEPIPDLVASLAGDESLAPVFRIAFAAEDSELDKKAVEKMKRKGVHGIVANDISRRDIGFGSDYNAGVLFFADGSRHELEKATKREMSDRILDLVLPRLNQP